MRSGSLKERRKCLLRSLLCWSHRGRESTTLVRHILDNQPAQNKPVCRTITHKIATALKPSRGSIEPGFLLKKMANGLPFHIVSQNVLGGSSVFLIMAGTSSYTGVFIIFLSGSSIASVGKILLEEMLRFSEASVILFTDSSVALGCCWTRFSKPLLLILILQILSYI